MFILDEKQPFDPFETGPSCQTLPHYRLVEVDEDQLRNLKIFSNVNDALLKQWQGVEDLLENDRVVNLSLVETKMSIGEKEKCGTKKMSNDGNFDSKKCRS